MTMHINWLCRPCRHCGADIQRPNHSRHEESCEKKTPEQREKWKAARR